MRVSFFKVDLNDFVDFYEDILYFRQRKANFELFIISIVKTMLIFIALALYFPLPLNFS